MRYRERLNKNKNVKCVIYLNLCEVSILNSNINKINFKIYSFKLFILYFSAMPAQKLSFRYYLNLG
jgi:hypothetical protein